MGNDLWFPESSLFFRQFLYVHTCMHLCMRMYVSGYKKRTEVRIKQRDRKDNSLAVKNSIVCMQSCMFVVIEVMQLNNAQSQHIV